jgi:hypothetical protein
MMNEQRLRPVISVPRTPGLNLSFSIGILEEVVNEATAVSGRYLDSIGYISAPVLIECWKRHETGGEIFSCVLPAWVVPPVLNGIESALEQLKMSKIQQCGTFAVFKNNVEIDFFNIAFRTPDRSEIRAQVPYIWAMMEYLDGKIADIANKDEASTLEITIATADLSFRIPDNLVPFAVEIISNVTEMSLYQHQAIVGPNLEEMKTWNCWN